MQKSFNILILIALFSLNAQALFEVKDAGDNTVFSISDDGMRVINDGDTMMVISTSEARINLDNSKDKALSRSFSVSTTTTAKEGRADVLEVTTGSTTMREGGAGDEYTDFSPDNIFLGVHAGEITEGVNNLFLGNSSGFSNLNGGNNVYIGTESGHFSANTFQNTYVGYRSGYNMTGASNTVIGSSAGEEAGGTTNNTFVGSSTGKYASGGNNTFFGNSAGYAMSVANTGTRNTYIGQSAGSSTTSGGYNVLMGFNAGKSNRSGSYNTIIGYLAGEGSYDVSYSGNVFLGSFAGTNETASDRLYIANSSTLTPLIYGEFDNELVTINGELNVTGNTAVNGILNVKTLQIADMGSNNLGLNGDIVPYLGSTAGYDLGNNVDGEYWDDIVGDEFINYPVVKYSKDVKSIESGLDKIMKLRPVTFKSDRQRFGFIPDEVEKVIPEVVVSQDIDIDPKTGLIVITETEKGMNYIELIPVLIKSIQEQQKIIEKLDARIIELENKK